MSDERYHLLTQELDRRLEMVGGYALGDPEAAAKMTGKSVDYMRGWNEGQRSVLDEVWEAQAAAGEDDPRNEFERMALLAEDSFLRGQDGTWAVMLNDTWYYACADAEPIPEESQPEVARLFMRYGDMGLLWWVYRQREHLPIIPETRAKVEAMEALQARLDEIEAERKAYREAYYAKQKKE